jgi:hypothetical protein
MLSCSAHLEDLVADVPGIKLDGALALAVNGAEVNHHDTILGVRQLLEGL